MAKKRKTRARRPQQRRATRGHLRAVPAGRDPAEEQPLIADLRQGLRADSPWDLLMTASGMLHLTDLRSRDPFDDATGPRVDIDLLVESFTEIELRETSAALALLGELAPEESVRVRCRRALVARTHPLPDWLRRLDETAVRRVAHLSHVLGDGDNYALDLRLPGYATTLVVYVDHNMGTIVKDAFPADRPYDEVVAFFDQQREPDSELEPIALADTRARLAQAVDNGARVLTPLESDTWPQLRPLVEWLLRSMPEGGTPYLQAEWDEADQNELADAFFASRHGTTLDDEDHRWLLGNLLWFGTTQATHDPTRWSPVNVEVVLVDWYPRKVVADRECLEKLPELLRAFVRFCHARNGIDEASTRETLESVDRWQASYLQGIANPRFTPEDLEQLLGQCGHFGLDDAVRAVGGEEALAMLDDEPLPDEPFDWTDVEDAAKDRVGEILSLLDDHADKLLDTEHRTAARRLLHQVAVADAALLQRGQARTAAAGLAWLIAKANESTSYYGPLTMQELLEPFGAGSASQRARTFLAAVGLHDQVPNEISLGSADYLVSTRRAELIEDRDSFA